MSISAATTTIVSGEAVSVFQQISAFYITYSESIVTFLLALNVFMCALNTKWNWPIGLVAVTAYGLNAWFLYGLYADAMLQIFYLLTGIYGWYYWLKGGMHKTEAKIDDLDATQWVATIGLIVTGTFFIGHYLETSTDSIVPYLDAYTTVISLAAQIMLMYRIRTAWLFWVAANVVYIYMFHAKGLDQLSMLYLVFIGNAVFGYYNWTRQMKVGK